MIREPFPNDSGPRVRARIREQGDRSREGRSGGEGSHSSHGGIPSDGYQQGRDAVMGYVWLRDPALVILTGSQRVVYDEPAPDDWKPPGPVGFAPPPKHRAGVE